MADIKISELGAASAVNSTDIFPMTSSGVTVKATAQQIKNFVGVGNLADLDTTEKSSAVAAINEVDEHADNAQATANIVQSQVSNSGDAYSPSKPYKVGELCIYNNTLYRCTTACSAGSWATNQSCFTADTLTGIANDLNNKLSDLIYYETRQNTLHPSTQVAGERSVHESFNVSKQGYKAIAVNIQYETNKGCVVTSYIDIYGGNLYIDAFNMRTLGTNVEIVTQSKIIYVKVES